MFHKWVCSFRECRTNCQGSEGTTYEVYEGDNVLHGWRGSCWLGMEPVISSQEKLGRVQSSAFSVQPHLPAPGAGLVARCRHGRHYPYRLGSLRSTVGGINRAKMGKIRLKMGRSVKIRVKWGNWRKMWYCRPWTSGGFFYKQRCDLIHGVGFLRGYKEVLFKY